MKVMLFSEYLKTINDKEFKPTIICEINSIDCFPNGLVCIQEKLARCCSFSIKEDFLTIEYANNPIDENEIFQHDEIKCPYCGNEKTDSWEYDDDGSEICDSCGSEYRYEKIINVSYTTTIKKRNTNITKLE